MKKIIVFLLAVALSLSAFGCNEKNQSNLTNNETSELSLPNIEMFSDTKYENYEHHFSSVKTATYKYNGTVVDVSADDPRLIRLLNLIAYSYNNVMDVWVQGYILEEEINDNLSISAPMLEVTFVCDSKSGITGLQSVPKIVICKDQYLKFVDTEIENNGIEGELAERHWLCGSIVTDNNYCGLELSKKWGEPGWVDILKYVGF